MIVFANCKINLGLFVTSKRNDGFHNIESVFYPLGWNDSIEVEKNEAAPGKCKLVEYSATAAPDPEQNLCVKAYRLLDEKYSLPPVNLHIYKTIPMGAGLGGGSSDGSHTLKLLNNFFKLNIANDTLLEMAAKLGSDCPFFIENKPMLVKGRGEVLNPIDLDLGRYYFLVVHPQLHVSTAEAYSMIQPGEMQFDLANKITLHEVSEWKNFVHNDFEKPVFAKFPVIAEIKNGMYANGALFASMSGSGSAVYGIFEDAGKAEKAKAHFGTYTSKIIYPKDHLKHFVV